MIPRNVNSRGRRRNRVIRKRRQNFVRLLALAGISLVLIAVPGLRWLLWVQLALDCVIALYVWRLLVYKQRERQAARVVTELPAEEPYPEPAVVATPESPRRVIAK